MVEPNRTPEQRARDTIDAMLEQAGWQVQSRSKINFGADAGPGIAVREYQTDVGPADYVLFVDRKPTGVIEAKPEKRGHNITTVEEQSASYAAANLKWVKNTEPLPFVYESTGVLTRFTDTRDPRPRSREVFNFPRPETIREWRGQSAPLRSRLQKLPALDHAGLRTCQLDAIGKLEASFKDDRPRALIQMATGRARRTPPSPPSTGCSSTPTRSASSFWSIPGTSANRPNRSSWLTCRVTTTASSPSSTTCSA